MDTPLALSDDDLGLLPLDSLLNCSVSQTPQDKVCSGKENCDSEKRNEMEKKKSEKASSSSGKADIAVLVERLSVLHVKQLPLACNYDSLYRAFGTYGIIKEIRMDIHETCESWEAWISFAHHEDALQANYDVEKIKVCGNTVTGALCDNIPRHLDVYHPALYNRERSGSTVQKPASKRTPKPPMWLIATAKEEAYNYYRFSKYLQQKVGGITSGDITRFGKHKVLIHAKSKVQSYMLSHLKVEESEMLKEIKPHKNFSYGRGVIFDRDLYDFSEEEILDMCPANVFSVKRVPRTKMIILTFEDANIPSVIVIENERIPVRPFKQRPLQCFNCFRYGHPSVVCKNKKLCEVCSDLEHGECSATKKCFNCQKEHMSRDKTCPQYKAEEAALHKASTEHISVGYAKKILGQTRNYAKAVKSNIGTSIRNMPRVKAGLSQVAIPPLQEGAKPSGNAPPPSPSPSTQMSQVESLPDIQVVSQTNEPLDAPTGGRVHGGSEGKNTSSPNRGRKRGGQLSPPTSPSINIPTTNRYDVLSLDTTDNTKTKLSTDMVKKKIRVDIHHPPQPKSDNDKHKVGANKPTISRSSSNMSSSNRPQQEKTGKNKNQR